VTGPVTEENGGAGGDLDQGCRNGAGLYPVRWPTGGTHLKEFLDLSKA
jgi:hypothetical protein